MQFTTAFAALEVFTEHSAATKSPAESFEAELRSAVHFAAEPFSVIFDALEASTLQETASTEALIFDALDAATAQDWALTETSIFAALYASMANLSAFSTTSLEIFAALDASRARMLPLAGTVTVTSAFERLFIDLSIVAVSRPPLASTTT